MRLTEAQLRQYFIPRLRSFVLIEQFFWELRPLFFVGTSGPFNLKQDMKHTQTVMKSESLPCKPIGGRSIQEKMGNKFVAELDESSSPPLLRVSSIDMLTKLLRMGIIGLMLCAADAWAGPGSIQGVVRDAKGQPIKSADVRVESRDGKQLFNTVKTDARGRYISQGLQPGVYRVSLVVNGAIKASITNTKTKSDQTTQLNFDLKPVAAAQANTQQKSGKHMVWMPPSTGSHTGGRWVEVDGGGTDAANALNVKRGSAETLRQQQLQQPPGSVPGGGLTTPP
jgi:hypothetical protein